MRLSLLLLSTVVADEAVKLGVLYQQGLASYSGFHPSSPSLNGDNFFLHPNAPPTDGVITFQIDTVAPCFRLTATLYNAAGHCTDCDGVLVTISTPVETLLSQIVRPGARHDVDVAVSQQTDALTVTVNAISAHTSDWFYLQHGCGHQATPRPRPTAAPRTLILHHFYLSLPTYPLSQGTAVCVLSASVSTTATLTVTTATLTIAAAPSATGGRPLGRPLPARVGLVL
jgi:hypothetical protein